MRREGHAPPLQWRVQSPRLPGNLQLPMALTPRKGDAASVRRQSRQRLRSDRRYTPYFGVCRFHGRLYGSEVRSRERHAAPLQWCTPFNDSRYELEVPSRDCHVASLLAMTNLWLSPFYRLPALVGSIAPGPAVRSPTTHGRRPAYFSFFIFQFSGFISMRPLPYNAFPAALRKIPRSAFHVFFHKFSIPCA